MEISKDKKIYFSSDNHLGSPSTEEMVMGVAG